MRAGAGRGHSAALVAPECPVNLERLGFERALWQMIEYMMSIERAVVASDSCMVAADDLVRAAIVLPKKRMQQRLARSGIAHVERVAGLNHRLLHEILFRKHRDRPGPNLGGNITRFQGA